MDSLSSIINSKDYEGPTEILSIKKYVMDEFDVAVGVQVRDNDIVISVPNSALANTLRLRSPELKRHCGINKHLTFRLV